MTSLPSKDHKTTYSRLCSLTVKVSFILPFLKTANYFSFSRNYGQNYRKTPFYSRNLEGSCLFSARKRNPEMFFFDQEFGVWLEMVYSPKYRCVHLEIPTTSKRAAWKVLSASEKCARLYTVTCLISSCVEGDGEIV